MTTRLELEANNYQRRQADALERIAAALEQIALGNPPKHLIDPMTEDPATWMRPAHIPPTIDDAGTKDHAAIFSDLLRLTADGTARTVRKAAGYSTEDFAEQMGVSSQTLGSWERGETKPSLHNGFHYYYRLRRLMDGVPQ